MKTYQVTTIQHSKVRFVNANSKAEILRAMEFEGDKFNTGQGISTPKNDGGTGFWRATETGIEPITHNKYNVTGTGVNKDEFEFEINLPVNARIEDEISCYINENYDLPLVYCHSFNAVKIA